MKAITTVLVLLLTALCNTSRSQVDVTANSVTTSYSTMKGAFDAINTGQHTGEIIIVISGIVSESQTAELQASGNNTASDYTSIVIEPANSVFLKIISGNFDAPVIDLNGADNVTFNGRDSLTIQNNSNTDLASVIRFRNGAQNNVIRNCLIRGASIGVQSGNILFAGSENASGNNSNTVSKCRFIEATPAKTDVHILSTGSPSAPNSSNSISGNLFEDFRNSGVHIGAAGNGGSWNISGNSFYHVQNNFNNNAVVTALRFIPGISSSGNIVDSNFIGGTQPLCSGAVWQNTGITAFRAITIQCGVSSYTFLRGNTISNILLSASGGSTFRGIEILQGNVNAQGNTIGSHSVISSIDLRGNFRNFGIFASTSDTARIAKNIVANITNIAISPSVSGGLIGIDAGSAGTSPTTAFITGNKILSLRTNSSLTTFIGSVRNAMGINFSPSIFRTGIIDSNTVNSISSENTGLTQFSPCGIRANNLRGSVTRNVVFDIKNSGTSVSTQPTATGICISSAGSNGNLVANNMITLGSGQSTNTSFIGINVQFSGTQIIKIFHNSVRIEGTASALSTHNSFAFYRGTLNNNTSTNPVEIRNNIFDNARSGGNGKHFAIGNQGSNPGSGWLSDSINNNLLNASNTSEIGFWRSSAFGITAWRDSSGGDEFSPSGFAQTYVSTSAGNLRLNNGINPTPIESGAQFTASAGNDIDGNTRPVSGAVNGGGISSDIGASESDMTPDDIFGPVISFQSLPNTSRDGNRILSDFASISDLLSSVNTTNQKRPRFYFKKSTDADAFGGNTSADNGWKFAQALDTESPFDFLADYSILNGGLVSSGDTIEYFVTAQDNSANTTSLPSAGFAASSVDSVISSPSVPLRYIVTQEPLSGTVSVGLELFNRVSGMNVEFRDIEHDPRNGTKFRKILNGREFSGRTGYDLRDTDGNVAGAVYPTITDAATDISLRGIDGPTQILLHDSVFQTEVFPISFNITNEFRTTAQNNIVIRPAQGVKTEIRGSISGNAMMEFVNMGFIELNGSSEGDGLQERDIAFMNLAEIEAHLIHLHNISLDTATEKQVRMKNLLLQAIGILQDNKAIGIKIGNYNNSTFSGSFEDILIQDIKFFAIAVGVNLNGGGDQRKIRNVKIDGLKMDTAGAFANMNIGVSVSGATDVTIENSSFGNFNSLVPQKDAGIVTEDISGNVRIVNNEISNLDHTGNGGFGGSGIVINNSNPDANIAIVNNVIHGMQGDGTNNDLSNSKNNPSGITINSNAGNTKIVHNSINMTGNTLKKTGAVSSAIKLLGNSMTSMINNVFVNNLGGDSTSVGSAAINIVSVNQLAECNNNNYYSSPGGQGSSGVAKIGTGGFIDLEEWKQLTGKDSRSVSGQPGYTSSGNLNPNVNDPLSWNINNAGAFTDELFDRNGVPRSDDIFSGQPDIGAFEFTPEADPLSFSSESDGNGNFDIISGNDVFLGTVTAEGGVNFSAANLPDTLVVKYFQGAVPPDLLPGDKHGFGYIEIISEDPVPQGVTFTVTLNIDSLATGSITNPSVNTVAAKNDGGFWTVFPAGTGNGRSELNWEQKTVRVRGITEFSAFALTDDNSPLPVELSSFTANVDLNNVNLKWRTSTEVNNSGFDVERFYDEWKKIGYVAGVNQAQGSEYEFSDRDLPAGSYRYRLKQIDHNGNYEYHDLSGEVRIGIPQKFELSQNYPNPFNPATTIAFNLPKDTKVKLEIFDMSGRLVKTLVDKAFTAGYYKTVFSGSEFPSGVYIYRFTAGSFTSAKKMTLIK